MAVDCDWGSVRAYIAPDLHWQLGSLFRCCARQYNQYGRALFSDERLGRLRATDRACLTHVV